MFDSNNFVWNDNNIEHIARHGVQPWEAEEAVGDPGRVTRRRRGGRLAVIGATEAGRVLVVILDREDNDVWRVVTARDSSQNEKRSYRRRRR